MNEDINKINAAETAGDVEALKNIAEEAGITMQGDVEQAANDAIKRITEKANEAVTTTPGEANRVAEQGGDMGVVSQRTAEVDARIASVETNTEQEIQSIQATPTEAIIPQAQEAIVSEEAPVPSASENNWDGKTTNSEGQTVTFLETKAKQEKFDELQAEFLKHHKQQEFDINGINESFANKKPDEINKILENLPKDTILKLSEDPKNYQAINAMRDWKANVGGQIGKLSNERVNYYDTSNKKEAVVIGTVPAKPADYLQITASASRFFPKEVSEKFIKDGVDAFIDKNKRGVTSGMNSLRSSFGDEVGNVLRNLCEGGYKDEAKKLLLEDYTRESSRLSLEDRAKVGQYNLIFQLSQEGLLSQEEVQEILDKSGSLEEPKQVANNESWGSSPESTAETIAPQAQEATIAEEPPAPPVTEAPAVETVQDPKQEKFNEIQIRFTENQQKKTEDPNSPVNKISSFVEDTTSKIKKEQFKMMLDHSGEQNFDGQIRPLNVTPQQLEDSLPDLYKKGIITKSDYTGYIINKSYAGHNRVQTPEFNNIVESIPKDIVNELKQDYMLSPELTKWQTTISQEIDNEVKKTRKNNDGSETFEEPEKILRLSSNLSRFADKDKLAPTITSVTDQYLQGGYNISRLMKGNQCPVIENLFESGFNDQAEKLLQKALSRVDGGIELVMDYQKKGYITAEQAKDILDKGGSL